MDGPNLYHYGFNNPVNGFDPDGLSFQQLLVHLGIPENEFKRHKFEILKFISHLDSVEEDILNDMGIFKHPKNKNQCEHYHTEWGKSPAPRKHTPLGSHHLPQELNNWWSHLINIYNKEGMGGLNNYWE